MRFECLLLRCSKGGLLVCIRRSHSFLRVLVAVATRLLRRYRAAGFLCLSLLLVRLLGYLVTSSATIMLRTGEEDCRHTAGGPVGSAVATAAQRRRTEAVISLLVLALVLSLAVVALIVIRILIDPRRAWYLCVWLWLGIGEIHFHVRFVHLLCLLEPR